MKSDSRDDEAFLCFFVILFKVFQAEGMSRNTSSWHSCLICLASIKCSQQQILEHTSFDICNKIYGKRFHAPF